MHSIKAVQRATHSDSQITTRYTVDSLERVGKVCCVYSSGELAFGNEIALWERMMICGGHWEGQTIVNNVLSVKYIRLICR